MIRQYDQCFVLETAHSSYILRILPTKQLEHLYYGKKLTITSCRDIVPLIEQHAFAPGNTNIYDEEHPEYSLEDIRSWYDEFYPLILKEYEDKMKETLPF